jgi:uncharacterized protein YjeT (DUF2065 family)
MHPVTLVRAIAVLFMLAGIVYVLQPDALRKVLQAASSGKVPHIIAVVRVCVGVLFIWTGGRLHAAVLGLIGVLVLVSGIMGLVAKLETQRSIANKLAASSEMTRRMVGLAAVVIASIILLDTWNRW